MATAERNLRNLFKRCVDCPTETPSCPPCSSSQICSMISQTCTECAHNVCIDNPNPPPPSQHNTNVGGIAGGVIGGVAFVLIVMVLLWRFWIKKRRVQQELEAYEWDEEEEDDVAGSKSGNRFTMHAGDAASTRTRASLAETIMSRVSRASNVIQIAFIPGVTNRGGSARDSLLTNVPVPPIPAAYANHPPKSPLSNDGDAILFRPEDLRGSTYSAASSRSGYRDTQYSQRQSITPSLASGLYFDDATMDPMPATAATAATRHLPRMVSIRTPSQTSSATASPLSGGHHSLSTDTATRPPAVRSISGGSFTKATQVNVNKKGRFPIRAVSDASTLASTSSLGGGSHHVPSVRSPLIEMSGDSESEDEHARARRSLLRDTGSPNSSAAATPILQPVESPFFDASELPLATTPPPPLISTAASVTSPLATMTNAGSPPSSSSSSSSSSFSAAGTGNPRPNPYAAMSSSVGSSVDPRPRRAPMGGLSAVIEEATRRSSRVLSPDGSGRKPEFNPFSDAHAAE